MTPPVLELVLAAAALAGLAVLAADVWLAFRRLQRRRFDRKEGA